jgi:hypothetical protein
VAQITSHGYRVVFSKNECSITSTSSDTVVRVPKKDNAYLLQCSTPISHANVCQNDSAVSPQTSPVDGQQHGGLDLWHLRLAHIGSDSLKLLAKQKLIPGSDTDELSFCESCVQGKQHRLPFPASMSRSTKLLQLVHSDVCGPILLKMTPQVLRNLDCLFIVMRLNADFVMRRN